MEMSSQVAPRDAMSESQSHRAIQEVQAALVVAKKFPRDEFAAIEKIKVACKRYELAEMAEYEYERGGTKIVGPTIDLLKAIAKRWGNIEYGWQELERKAGESIVRAYAWDMETNARNEMVFTVRHWRDTKQGGYALKDERDIYEATANFASRRVRACLEAIVDGDVIQTAVDECRRTLKGQNTEPLVDRARKMVSAFAEFGVTPGMIEDRLGHKLDAISENKLAELRRVYKSLKDGVGDTKDFFQTAGIKGGQPKSPKPAPANDTAAESAAGLAPAEAAKPGEPTGFCAKLADAVVEGGFNFDDFKTWAEKNCVPADFVSDDTNSFAEVKQTLAKRLLNNVPGLLKQMKAAGL